jgi:hypothetical protein
MLFRLRNFGLAGLTATHLSDVAGRKSRFFCRGRAVPPELTAAWLRSLNRLAAVLSALVAVGCASGSVTSRANASPSSVDACTVAERFGGG